MENKGKELANWLKNASLLNIAGLCKQAGIDRGNMDKYIQIGRIPDHHADKLLPILKNYGCPIASSFVDKIKSKLDECKVQVQDLNTPTHTITSFTETKPTTNYTVNTKPKPKMPQGLSLTDQIEWRINNP